MQFDCIGEMLIKHCIIGNIIEMSFACGCNES